MLTALLIYAAFGVLVGIVAGLLGLGGGLIVVPILLYSLPLQGVTEYNNHLALGTSMASIVFTSISSVRAHHARSAVLWPVVLRLAPGIILGTLVGGHVASRLSSKPLSIIFAFFLFYMSVQMFLDIKPKASRALPGGAALAGVGGGIGFVSSFVGIGGGSMTIPFLSWCNTDMRLAIGTSAGVGFPIALAGTAAYIIGGWNLSGLPEYSLGFVYLPALLGLVSTSMLSAPLGAKISHKVSVKKLKRFFAVFLFLMGLNMVYKILM